MKNIILIGMSGAGKSTLGVLLAKAMNMSFVDTDLLIQKKDGRLLHQIIEEEGIEYFKQVEEEVLLGLDMGQTVIATGGSVVYSSRGMKQLGASGKIVFLDVAFEEIEKRIHSITTRGIVMAKGQTLKNVYEERYEKYKLYSDIIIKIDRKNIEETLAELVNELDA